MENQIPNPDPLKKKYGRTSPSVVNLSEPFYIFSVNTFKPQYLYRPPHYRAKDIKQNKNHHCSENRFLKIKPTVYIQVTVVYISGSNSLHHANGMSTWGQNVGGFSAPVRTVYSWEGRRKKGQKNEDVQEVGEEISNPIPFAISFVYVGGFSAPVRTVYSWEGRRKKGQKKNEDVQEVGEEISNPIPFAISFV
ncbi:hypothetical protein CEXT_47751 [Caerostris extrusa]|uniref:Uncharacterized protein n=1 Tax=Caerostris extrusa TaxID=172846 RepID=A0AAV4UPF8_CAEEX|nr:hypothetical protein CEXT_47751 [Caerostris extrusa]